MARKAYIGSAYIKLFSTVYLVSVSNLMNVMEIGNIRFYER